MLKLYKVENYNDAVKPQEIEISFDNSDKIREELEKNNYYHIKLYKNKTYKLFFDIDGFNGDINDFLNKIMYFFNSSYNLDLTIDDFVYTENDSFINNEELPNFYHVVIPKYSCSLDTMKYMRKEFIAANKNLSNVYDSSVYKNNGFFRLPNQSKGNIFIKKDEKTKELTDKEKIIKDLKEKGIHRIKNTGDILDFVFDYGIDETENIENKVCSTVVKVNIEPIDEELISSIQLKEDKNLPRLKSLLNRLQKRNTYTTDTFHESQFFTLLTLIKSAGGTWKLSHKICQFLPNHSPCKCEHSFNSIKNVVLDPLVQLEKLVIYHDELIYKAKNLNKEKTENLEKIFRFDFSDEYCLDDFRKEFQDGIFDFNLIEKLHKICVFIVKTNTFLFKVEKGIIEEAKIQQILPRVYNPKTDKSINWNIELATRHNMSYTKSDYGFTIDRENNVFNKSVGYLAKQIDEIDQNVIDIMLDLVMKVYANNDQRLYEYFISYFAYLLQNNKKIDTCLILISDQGYGKTVFFKIMGLIIGPNSCNTNLTQIEKLGKGFNTYSEGNRLVVVNEIATAAADFKSTWETFKSLVTDSIETVEGKYEKGKQVVNICDYVLVSNHEEAIIIEEEDRRFVVFECNNYYHVDNKNIDKFRKNNDIKNIEKYDRNEKYWDNFHNTMYSKNAINSIYTYFMNYKIKVNLRNVIMTPIKKRMILRSLSSPLKFLYSFSKDIRYVHYIKDNKIGSTLFYTLFTNWIKEEGEIKQVTQTKFGFVISKKLDKIKNNIIYYDLTKLRDFTEFYDSDPQDDQVSSSNGTNEQSSNLNKKDNYLDLME